MGLTIFWLRTAENKLEDIFHYYHLKAGKKAASKIVAGIVSATINLEKNPKIGQIELFLENRKQGFRYLIYTNYKIVYSVNEKKQRIDIVTVFDTRQNPDKLISATKASDR